MKKTINLILVSVFCLILILPNFFFIYESKIQNDEFQKAISLPVINIKHIGFLMLNFDNYFKESFGGRDVLLKINNWINVHILKSSPIPKAVVFGKNDWMFLGNSHGNVIYENIGAERFSDFQLEIIQKNVESNKEWLEQQGIKYYLCIAPNKHSIYDRYLPSYFQNKRERKLEQLKTYLKKHNFELIDMKDYFNEYNTLSLYHKTNTHWNDIGAFLGYRRLMHSIKKDFDIGKVFEFEDFTLDTLMLNEQDLTKMMHIKTNDSFIVMKPKTSYKAKKISKKLKIPEQYYANPLDYEYRYEGSGKFKLLMFRDSFSINIIPFLNESFKESVFIWQHNFKRELVIDEKPDIVIQQIVERDIDALLY
jgi:alginate O-acetyltransferase complex protein AlgJ